MRITSTPPPSQSVLEVSRNMRAKHFENRVDLSAIAERLDTYESRNPSSRIENIMYDQNGNLLNLPESGKVEVRDGVSGEGELQKLHEGLREVIPLTQEEITLMKGASRIEGEIAKRIMRAKIKLSNILNRSGKQDTVQELFSMYDKQFGTDSSKEMEEFKKIGRVNSLLYSMRHALFDASHNGQNSDYVMDYADGSFSRADFDYVMGMGENYDYESHSFNNEDCIKNPGAGVNSELKDVAIDFLTK